MLKMNSLFPISRYGSPFEMLSTFDDMFETMIGLPTRNKITSKVSALTVPRANVLKDAKGYTIELAVPGFSRSDFDISVNENVLTVSSEVEVAADYKNNISAQEYSYNTFSRSWTLPTSAHMKGIDARYEAGILSIEVPVESGIGQSIQIDVK